MSPVAADVHRMAAANMGLPHHHTCRADDVQHPPASACSGGHTCGAASASAVVQGRLHPCHLHMHPVNRTHVTCLAAAYVEGSLRPFSPDAHVSPPVKAHMHSLDPAPNHKPLWPADGCGYEGGSAMGTPRAALRPLRAASSSVKLATTAASCVARAASNASRYLYCTSQIELQAPTAGL